MRKRRVYHVKSKSRTVLSTHRRAHKKTVSANINSRNHVYRLKLMDEEKDVEIEVEQD
jgi:hypothetical protein